MKTNCSPQFNFCLTLLCAALVHFASHQAFAATILQNYVEATHTITESTQISNPFAANINPADFYVGDANGRQFVVNEGVNGSLYYQNGGESVFSLAQLSSYLENDFYNVHDGNSYTTIKGVTKGDGLASIGLKSNYSGLTVSLFNDATDVTTNVIVGSPYYVGTNGFTYSFSLYQDEAGFDHWTVEFKGSQLVDAINGLESNLINNASDWAFLFNFGADTYLDSLEFQVLIRPISVYVPDSPFDQIALPEERRITLNYDASAATPEPATMLIFGLGIAGLGLARRKRK